MRLILSTVKKHARGFSIALLFLVVEALCDLSQPTLMANIIDRAVPARDVREVLLRGGVMLLIALVGAIGAVGRNYFASHVSQNIGRELRSDIFKKVQTLPLENIDRLEPASLITRITNDVTQMQNFINGCMRILVKAPITCIGAIALIVWRAPSQIPLMGAILLIAGVLITLNMKLGYPRFGRMQATLDELNDTSREYLTSVRVVKAFGREAYENERFGRSAKRLAQASLSALRVNVAFAPLISLTVNLGIVAMLWFGGYGGTGQVGELMAAVNYMTQILFALGMVSNILNSMVRATASANRIGEVLGEEPAMSEDYRTEHLDPGQGVVFEGVSFRYAGAQQPAIEELSFSLDSGMTCGIIGATGSGKSTLISLIPRFYDATDGRVFVGGCDVKDVSVRALRAHIAIVTQKAVLFTGTIAQNLRWGDDRATDEQIRNAARAAAADEFIEKFGDGYETHLGQGGVNLSGGQKQRLSIARAILRRPRLLILDDCTSALDATTEAAVMQGIRAHSKGMTMIVISQKISSVRNADLILCMHEGRIAGMGRHEALLETCEEYRQIYFSQIGGDIDG